MDSKINFTLVGVFLVTFIVALIGFSVWLGKYGLDTKKVDLYNVFLEESVSGLNVESAIKYKGLNVGVVKKIKINPTNSEQIELLLEIDHGTPIKQDTVAVLESQGITGLKYIDLIGGSRNVPLLKTDDDSYIPTITSKKSLMGSLGDKASGITYKVDSILTKVDKLLSPTNLDNISKSLENINDLTKNLNSTVSKIDKTTNDVLSSENINHINTTLKNISSSTQRLENLLSKVTHLTDNLDTTVDETKKMLVDDFKVTLQKISEASESTNQAFAQVDTLLQSGQFDLKDITKDSLRQFDVLLLELERTIQNIEQSIDGLSNSPSDILFKRRDDNFGPGEKNE